MIRPSTMLGRIFATVLNRYRFLSYKTNYHSNIEKSYVSLQSNCQQLAKAYKALSLYMVQFCTRLYLRVASLLYCRF